MLLHMAVARSGVVRPRPHVARSRRWAAAATLVAVGCVLSACQGASSTPARSATTPTRTAATATPTRAPHSRTAPQFRHRIPGMPPVIGNDVYSQTRAGMLAPQVRHDPTYPYVPYSTAPTVPPTTQPPH